MQETKRTSFHVNTSSTAVALSHLLFLLLLLSSSKTKAAESASNIIALPGCPNSCGGVSIPYPFGIGPNCFMASFEVSCNATDNGTFIPCLGETHVLNIDLSSGQTRVNMPVSYQCYNNTNKSVDVFEWNNDLSDHPYRFNPEQNKFVVIGYGALGYLNFSNNQNYNYSGGCFSGSDSLKNLTDGLCSGIGCCQTSIPKGTYLVEFSFDPNFQDFTAGPCNYAMLTEEVGFKFNTNYITTDMLLNQYMPAVYDWAIADTCDKARMNSSSFACISESSVCVDSNSGLGYICRCYMGYQGNPYFLGGCQDIDECVNQNLCSKGGKCHNLPGSYKCSCSFGWRNKYDNFQECERNWALIIGISFAIGAFGMGATLLPLVLASLSLIRRLDTRRKQKLRQKFFKQHYELYRQRLISSSTEDTSGQMKIFGLEELEKATNIFDQSRVLGRGGHGTVYKGILSDLRVVAIKKSNSIIQTEIDQFINEIVILLQINHRNVVKLLGCCLETEVPLLVYEFVSNGTLSDHLHVQGGHSIPWKDRVRIALETARAISYLHSAASMSVFHRDLKCSNVLLDDRLTAKLSDFGASKSVKIDQTGLTTAIQGTYGYLDPEYYYTGRLTEKSDVYSFGVILAELLTRKKVYSSSMPSESGSLIAQFLTVMAENRLIDIIDTQIVEEGPIIEQIEEVAMLTERCLRMRGEERPGMKEVEVRLELIWDSKKGSTHPPMPTSQHLVEQLSIPRITTVGDDRSRQYSLEEEMLLSAKFGR